MDLKSGLIVSLAAVGMFLLLIIAVFGDKGATDLYLLRQEKGLLVQQNERLEAENRELLQQIERLREDDLGFVESIARQELGMVKDSELILKIPSKKPED